MPWWPEDEDSREDLSEGDAAKGSYILKEQIAGPIGDLAWTEVGFSEREEILKRRTPQPANCRFHNPKSCRTCDGFASLTSSQRKRWFCKASLSNP